jgi:hypothetical protein
LAAKTGGRVGHGAIGEVADGLVKRGVRAASEGISKAIGDFHRATAEGLKAVATRTREADARAAQGFKDVEHSGPKVPRVGQDPKPKMLGPGPVTTKSLGDIQKLPRGPARGAPGSQYVRDLYKGGKEATHPRRVPSLGGRRVDVPTRDMDIEVKHYGRFKSVGGKMQSVPLTRRLQEEIDKDTYLRARDHSYRPVWMFTDASPSADLLDMLKARNIEVVIYGRG